MNKKVSLKNRLFAFWDNNYDYYRTAEGVEYEPYFIRARERLLKEVSLNSKVLDLACGSAELLENIAEKATYFGVDVSCAALDLANKRKRKNSHFIQADVGQLPIRTEALDSIVCINSVEHFTEPKTVLNEIWRICKKGGRIVFLSPNWGDYIFKVPPPLTKINQAFIRRSIYIGRQLIYQTIRIINNRACFFPLWDCSSALGQDFAPDNDAVYIASIREIGNYFRSLGAQNINIEFRRENDFVRPWPKNIVKNLFRLYRKINPYYKYHGANLLLITK